MLGQKGTKKSNLETRSAGWLDLEGSKCIFQLIGRNIQSPPTPRLPRGYKTERATRSRASSNYETKGNQVPLMSTEN